MEIKIVKMKSGEEFVADVKASNADSIVVENPVVVSQRYNENNEVESALVPWCAFSKSREFTINNDDVMFVVDTTDNMVSVYTKQFSTIIQPNSPQILHS